MIVESEMNIFFQQNTPNSMTKDVTMMSQGDFNSLVLEQFPIHLLATLGSELLQAFEELPGRENNQFVRMML